MTSKLTREQVIALITEHSYDSALVDALEYLLAAMDSEPVYIPEMLTPVQASRAYCGEVRGYRDGWNACRAAMLQAEPVTTANKLGNSPVIPDCWCRTCRPVALNDTRFVVCPDCGNKRCPRANDHRNSCTGSNEPGQEGSAYPADPHATPALDPEQSVVTVSDTWISVSERMPKVGDEILYFCQEDGMKDCGIVSSSNFSGKGDKQLYVYTAWGDLHFGVEITQWMPLPAAPQEVKGE
ncbi:TPA: DUF551 domain-containing protein [Klebsiella aerogenes]|nr:DUF551 domain-containing protein [Klebsiella aerogenes]